MLKVLDHLEEWLIAFLMAAATLLIFVAVLHRYAAGWPIPVVQDWLLSLNLSWAQELCIYMFIWMAKFGAAYGVRTGIHVGVDVLINRLPQSTRRRLRAVRPARGRAVHRVVGTLGAHYVLANRPHRSGLGRPRSCRCGSSTCAFRCGSYLMCFRFLQVAWTFFKTGELPQARPCTCRRADRRRSTAISTRPILQPAAGETGSRP